MYTLHIIPVSTKNPPLFVRHHEPTIAHAAAADYAKFSDVLAVEVTNNVTGEIEAIYE